MPPKKTDGREPARWFQSLQCDRNENASTRNQTTNALGSGRLLHPQNQLKGSISNEITGSVLRMIVEKAQAPCYSTPKRPMRRMRSATQLQEKRTPHPDAQETPHLRSFRESCNILSSGVDMSEHHLQQDFTLSDPLLDSPAFTDPVICLDGDNGSRFEELPSMIESAIDSDMQDSECSSNSDTCTGGDAEHDYEYTEEAAQGEHRRIVSTNLIDLRLVKENMDKLHTARESRSKLSIGLPINASSSERGSGSIDDISATITHQSQQERELEYKHRHTFIGTASLDDFLELLDVSGNFSTSRSKVAKAFISLAAKEQAMVREQSRSSEGWELVPRMLSPDAHMPADYLAQSRIKLGSVSLTQFLELLQFNRDDETDVIAVVNAFCSAAHLDGMSSDGARSKAKAVRRWMIRQI